MEGDAGMWVLLAMSVVCFGALIGTNRAGPSDPGAGPHGPDDDPDKK